MDMSTQCIYHPKVQCTRSWKKMSISSSFPKQQGLYFANFQNCGLRIRHLIQQVSGYLLLSSPLGHWWVLAWSQLLEATKNKNGGLGSHKCQKNRVWASLTHEVNHLPETTLSRLAEVIILANAQKPTERVKKNENTNKQTGISNTGIR